MEPEGRKGMGQGIGVGTGCLTEKMTVIAKACGKCNFGRLGTVFPWSFK